MYLFKISYQSNTQIPPDKTMIAKTNCFSAHHICQTQPLFRPIHPSRFTTSSISLPQKLERYHLPIYSHRCIILQMLSLKNITHMNLYILWLLFLLSPNIKERKKIPPSLFPTTTLNESPQQQYPSQPVPQPSYLHYTP